MGQSDPMEATASTIISFVEKLEESSTRFYTKLAERYKEGTESFLAFAKEDERTKVLVTRTYQETITDALEACFSFKGFNLSDHIFETTLAEDASYQEALKAALELEEKASRFYMDVAERSRSLLATIPRAFGRAAEVRNRRKMKLQSLLSNLE